MFVLTLTHGGLPLAARLSDLGAVVSLTFILIPYREVNAPASLHLGLAQRMLSWQDVMVTRGLKECSPHCKLGPEVPAIINRYPIQYHNLIWILIGSKIRQMQCCSSVVQRPHFSFSDWLIVVLCAGRDQNTSREQEGAAAISWGSSEFMVLMVFCIVTLGKIQSNKLLFYAYLLLCNCLYTFCCHIRSFSSGGLAILKDVFSADVCVCFHTTDRDCSVTFTCPQKDRRVVE